MCAESVNNPVDLLVYWVEVPVQFQPVSAQRYPTIILGIDPGTTIMG
jgi:hypothetical protein